MKAISTILVLHVLLTAALADWRQWRGPAFNGTAPDAQPPIEWSGSKNVKWKIEIPGRGSSTPVVAGHRIFVTTAIDTGKKGSGAVRTNRGGDGDSPDSVHQFVIMCIDRNSGKMIWQKTTAELVPHSGYHSHHGYASASAITNGTHVWAHFGSRGTYCLTVDGDLVWSRTNLGQMQTRGGFGDGSTPVLSGNALVIPWDHEGDSYITALNAKTGDTVWKTPRDGSSSWVTPLVVEHEGTRQVIQNGVDYARAYDLKDGKELWRAKGQTTRPVATPVAGEGMVFLGSGHRGAFLGAYKLSGAKGDITQSAATVWTLEKGSPDVPSLLLSDGRLYFHQGRDGILSCHDAKSGKAHYSRERIDGLRTVYASPVAAAGHVFLTGRDGTTVVIKDSPKLEIVATNKLGEPVDATPVPVGKEMLIRGARHLFCISNEPTPGTPN